MEEQNKHIIAIRSNPKKGKHLVAQSLVEKYQIITIAGDNTSTIYIYNKGIYIEGEKILRKELQEMYGEEATSNVKSEVITKIQDMTFTTLEETKRDNYNLLPVANGVFDLTTSKIIDYKPDYYFFAKLPVAYNPESKCPIHKQFFSEILDEKDIRLVQELFGFCLYRKIFLKKAFILVGAKNTGKSTFLKALTNMLGLTNVCGVSLQKLTNDKFSIGNLFRKYANIYDDLDSQGINNHGAFKIASGGGVVSGEKKFGDEFQFISYAKSVFACNKIPDVKDIDDDAYFDRWILLNFNKDIAHIDPFLDEKLNKPEEVSGLLNWSIGGLKRLLKYKSFSNYMTSEDTRLCMLKNSNSISSFAQDWLTSDPESSFMLNDELYDAYRLYCIQFNLPLLSETKFHRDIEKYAIYAIKNTSSLNKYAKQMRGYSGIKIDMSGTDDEPIDF